MQDILLVNTESIYDRKKKGFLAKIRISKRSFKKVVHTLSRYHRKKKMSKLSNVSRSAKVASNQQPSFRK